MKLKLLTIFVGGGLAIGTACAAAETETSSPPVYSFDEVAWSRTDGTGAVKVSANAMGPKLKTCAGEVAWLRPRSAIEDYRTRAVFGNLSRARIPVTQYLGAESPENPNMPAPPAAYNSDARKARCSSEGTFLFSGVPDGEYNAVVLIFPREYLGRVTPIEDIEVVLRHVMVVRGKTTRIDLLFDQ
jgi:hypothetical protein